MSCFPRQALLCTVGVSQDVPQSQALFSRPQTPQKGRCLLGKIPWMKSSSPARHQDRLAAHVAERINPDKEHS